MSGEPMSERGAVARAREITAASHPALYAALDYLSYDGGGRSGHKSYVVPGDWDLDKAEATIAPLTEEQRQTLTTGEETERLALIQTLGIQYADEVVGAFFDHGGCPVCDADRLGQVYRTLAAAPPLNTDQTNDQ